MEALLTALRRFTALDPNKIVSNILRNAEVQRLIIELNTGGNRNDDIQGQLLDFQVTADSVLLPFYSPFTKERKQNKFGEFPDRYTFFDTGEFYDSFKVSILADSFIITANPIRDGDNIFEGTGFELDEVLGLTDESISELTFKLTPLVIEKIRDEVLR